MSILKKLKPDFLHFQKTGGGTRKRLVNFPRLWKSSVLLTAGVSLIPLIFITIVDYNVTQRSIESEFLLRTSRIVSNLRRTVFFFLEERRASLDFIIHNNKFEELKDFDRLAKILKNLSKSFGQFTDLSVIDASGVQRTYVGPYELKDKDYSSQKWYDQAVKQGLYISSVFMGYRRIPHFVIAVKRNLTEGNFFILRASLDIEPFERLLSEIDIPGAGDAFIINHQGILQTLSRNHGEVFEKINLPIPKYSSQTEVLEGKNAEGEDIVIGYRYIEQTPFILMIIKQKRVLMESWKKTRIKLVAFLVVSVILILAVIVSTVTYIVNKIYLADEKRVMALHEAEYANKMASIGRLASGVAHEINNPLAIINEKAGLIKDLFTFKHENAQHEKLIGLIDSVLFSVKRCGRITRRLLRFARHMDVSVEQINLEEVIHEVLGFLEKEAEYRSIEASVEVKDVPFFETDRGKLQQIFLNIINNAFSAMDDGGHLTIVAKKDGNNDVSVTIADDGYGIDEKEITHIFEPFFSTKTGQGGTGLGLSITYGLLQELGGDIGVRSKVGEGTVFTITLPLYMDEKKRTKA